MGGLTETVVGAGAETTENCTGCHTRLIPGTSFCAACGHSVQPNGMQKRSQGLQCSKCALLSPYNENYCAHCGTPVSGAAASPTPRQTLRWETPAAAEDAQTTTAPTPVNEHSPQPIKQKSNFKPLVTELISCALGAILGIAGWSISRSTLVQPKLEKSHWQGHSLVVRAIPAGATVRVQERQMRDTAAGEIPESGQLVFDNLMDGEYGLSIEKPDYKTVYGTIKISDGVPTVIGAPEPITLVKR